MCLQSRKSTVSVAVFSGANMNDALLRAVEFLVRQEEADPLATHVSMVMLVTDGRPTRGITDTTRILANVRQASGSRVCIFPVGLGLNVDFRFLDQLAQQNRGGAASRLLLSSETGDGVVVGSGADEPELAAGLKSFYRQIASPLLKNVRVRYDEVIDESGLTDVDFPAYFDGSEIVVAGQVKTGAPSRSSGGSQYTMVKVSGGSTKGYMSLDVRVKIPRATANSDSAGGRLASSGASTERMWAYLTVRRLLRKASGAANNSVIEATMASALQTASQVRRYTCGMSHITTTP